jgi:hypothetical protein
MTSLDDVIYSHMVPFLLARLVLWADEAKKLATRLLGR